MPDDPAEDGRAAESSIDANGEVTESVDDSLDATDAVDDEVQRRLREAYLNDEESVLVVTAVRSTDRRVVVELRPPHGGATHVERFSAPRDGSLAESEAFLSFLDAAGVSQLDVDEVVGTRVPATYDPDGGWRLDEAYVGGRGGTESDAAEAGRLSERWNRAAEWLWTYRYWLVAVLLVGGELLFVAVIVLLFA
ncbi:hypothetical protein DJ82_03590 [Halorubrum sp. Ib24]|uniref:hypothetical protein n=1 Tax=Halorubrum sp. Ib24 TaxID=1383850 RepID=UPI000B985E32|nr:hypothetical protein [Halorubrum sp. Ib24]OYR42134.1 hypothetical protein DJ82_03590 [Halorubrum sp. Ib24]